MTVDVYPLPGTTFTEVAVAVAMDSDGTVSVDTTIFVTVATDVSTEVTT
jgi:hypothetical protein